MALTNSSSASKNAKYYDAQWSSLSPEPIGEQETSRIKAICEALDDFGDQNKNLVILDLGCGRGWMAPYLSRFGKVNGVDFSDVGIQFAREYFSESGEFFLAKPQEATLGLGDKTFDVIVSSEVIEHVPLQDDYLRLLLRLLKPQGLCVLTTPNGNLWEKYKAAPHLSNHLQPVENWLTPDKFYSLIAKAGMVCLRHEGIPVHKMRLGGLRLLQHKRTQNWIEKFKLRRIYGKVMLQHALYQIIVARK